MLGLTITQWLFGTLSLMAIMFALMMVFTRSPVNSALYLIMTFFCIAAHYLLLNAQFLAVVQIVVYAGAIMVLFLYIIMLMNLNADEEPRKHVLTRSIAAIIGGLLLFVMIGALRGAEQLQIVQGGASQIGLVKNLGKVLFTEFLFPFEVASVLLLAAMVGAIMIGKRDTNINSKETTN